MRILIGSEAILRAEASTIRLARASSPTTRENAGESSAVLVHFDSTHTEKAEIFLLVVVVIVVGPSLLLRTPVSLDPNFPNNC